MEKILFERDMTQRYTLIDARYYELNSQYRKLVLFNRRLVGALEQLGVPTHMIQKLKKNQIMRGDG